MSKATYHDEPQHYAEITGFESEWRELFWRDDFLRMILRRVEVSPSANVLDVGCGAGHWGLRLLPLLPGEPKLTGVDQEPAFLEKAQRRAAERGISQSCQFQTGNAETLPFPDSSFDFVTGQLVLIHVPDVPAVLSEILRVLRPGGRVLLVEPDNQAGNHALLHSSMDVSDTDLAELLALQRACERGKALLGEGDDSLGARLPGMLRIAGFQDVDAALNERCIHLAPPYDAPHMRVALEQELEWADQGISVLLGTKQDAERRYLATGGTTEDFAARYEVVERWMSEFRRSVDRETYHAARGFVMYLVSGQKTDR